MTIRSTYHPVAIRLIVEDFKKIPDDDSSSMLEIERMESELVREVDM